MTCLRMLILLLAGVRTAYGIQHPIIGLTNPEPEPRVRPCSGVFGHTFIALGGFRAEFQDGPLNDLNVMDTRTGLWRTPVVRGTPPSPQAVGQGLCGGIVGTALVLFDPQAHRSHYLDVENWRWLDSAQCSGQRLFAEEYRRSPSVAVRGSSIFAFVSRSQGYQATPTGRSRLFRLDLAADGGCIGASEWVASSLQERTDEPCSIGGHVLWAFDGSIYLYGGMCRNLFEFVASHQQPRRFQSVVWRYLNSTVGWTKATDPAQESSLPIGRVEGAVAIVGPDAILTGELKQHPDAVAPSGGGGGGSRRLLSTPAFRSYLHLPRGAPGRAGGAPTAAAAAAAARGPVGETVFAGPYSPSTYSGPSGPTFSSGSSGPSGPTFSSGSSGPSGPTFSSGSSGPSGPTFSSGSSGPSGPTFSSGSSGPSGPYDPNYDPMMSGPQAPVNPYTCAEYNATRLVDICKSFFAVTNGNSFQVPPNQVDCTALDLKTNWTGTDNILGSTVNLAPLGDGVQSNTKVFVFELDENAFDVSFDLCNPATNYDTYMRLYRYAEGTDATSPPFQLNDDSSCSLNGLYSRVPTTGTTSLGAGIYFLAVAGYSVNFGNFEVTVNLPEQPCFSPIIPGSSPSNTTSGGGGASSSGGSGPAASGGVFPCTTSNPAERLYDGVLPYVLVYGGATEELTNYLEAGDPDDDTNTLWESYLRRATSSLVRITLPRCGFATVEEIVVGDNTTEPPLGARRAFASTAVANTANGQSSLFIFGGGQPKKQAMVMWPPVTEFALVPGVLRIAATQSVQDSVVANGQYFPDGADSLAMRWSTVTAARLPGTYSYGADDGDVNSFVPHASPYVDADLISGGRPGDLPPPTNGSCAGVMPSRFDTEALVLVDGAPYRFDVQELSWRALNVDSIDRADLDANSVAGKDGWSLYTVTMVRHDEFYVIGGRLGTAILSPTDAGSSSTTLYKPSRPEYSINTVFRLSLQAGSASEARWYNIPYTQTNSFQEGPQFSSSGTTIVSAKPEVFRGISGHAAVLVGSDIFIFGGAIMVDVSEDNVFSKNFHDIYYELNRDVFVFSPSLSSFPCKFSPRRDASGAPAANGTAPMYDFMAGMLGRRYIVAWGGTEGQPLFTIGGEDILAPMSVWAMDVAPPESRSPAISNDDCFARFRWFQPPLATSELPRRRRHAVVAALSDTQLVMFGGETSGIDALPSALTDAWVLSQDSVRGRSPRRGVPRSQLRLRWTPLVAARAGLAGQRKGGCGFAAGSRLFVMGGHVENGARAAEFTGRDVDSLWTGVHNPIVVSDDPADISSLSSMLSQAQLDSSRALAGDDIACSYGGAVPCATVEAAVSAFVDNPNGSAVDAGFATSILLGPGTHALQEPLALTPKMPVTVAAYDFGGAAVSGYTNPGPPDTWEPEVTVRCAGVNGTRCLSLNAPTSLPTSRRAVDARSGTQNFYVLEALRIDAAGAPGIELAGSTYTTIDRCVIQDAHAANGAEPTIDVGPGAGGGAGLWVHGNHSAIVTVSAFSANAYDQGVGGSVLVQDSVLEASSSVISGGFATLGGALAVVGRGKANLQSVSLSGSSGTVGGAMFLSSSLEDPSELEDVTVTDTYADVAPSLFWMRKEPTVGPGTWLQDPSNTASRGSATSAWAVGIRVTEKDDASTPLADVTLAPGDAMPPFSLFLITATGDVAYAEGEVPITISTSTTGASVSGTLTVAAVDGTVDVSELRVLAPTGIGVALTFSATLRSGPVVGQASIDIGLCQPGFEFSSATATCAQCPQGKYNPIEGGDCVECGPGSFGDEQGLVECTLCEAGTYNPSAGSTARSDCSACPAFTITQSPGSTDREQCICSPNFFKNPDLDPDAELIGDNTFCIQCAGVTGVGACTDSGTTVESLPLEVGFWRASANTTQVRPCPNKKLCLGGRDPSEYCVGGSTGPYCSLCRDGYGPDPGSGGECMLCADPDYSGAIQYGFGSLFAILVVGLILYKRNAILRIIMVRIHAAKRRKLALRLSPVALQRMRQERVRKNPEAPLALPMDTNLATASDAEMLAVADEVGISEEDKVYLVDLTEEETNAEVERVKQLAKGAVSQIQRSVVSKLKVLVAYYQIVSGFGGVFDLAYPQNYVDFMNRVDVVNVDAAAATTVFGCVSNVDFITSTYASTLLPIFFLAFCAGYLYMRYAVVRSGAVAIGPDAPKGFLRKLFMLGNAQLRTARDVRESSMDMFVTVYIAVTFLVFPSTSSRVMSTFRLDSTFDPPLLRSDYSISADSTRYQLFVPYAVLMVLVYPIFIPVSYLVLLYRYRDYFYPRAKWMQPRLRDAAGVDYDPVVHSLGPNPPQSAGLPDLVPVGMRLIAAPSRASRVTGGEDAPSRQHSIFRSRVISTVTWPTSYHDSESGEDGVHVLVPMRLWDDLLEREGLIRAMRAIFPATDNIQEMSKTGNHHVSISRGGGREDKPKSGHDSENAGVPAARTLAEGHDTMESIFAMVVVNPSRETLQRLAEFVRKWKPERYDMMQDEAYRYKHYGPIMKRYGSLTRMYEPSFWYFETVEMVRKLFFSTILIFFWDGTNAQIVAGIAASIPVLILYSTTSPFLEDEDDVLNSTAQWSLLVTLLCSLFIKTGILENEISDSVLAVPMILLNAAVFVLCIVYVFHALRNVVERITMERVDFLKTLIARRRKYGSLSPEPAPGPRIPAGATDRKAQQAVSVEMRRQLDVYRAPVPGVRGRDAARINAGANGPTHS